MFKTYKELKQQYHALKKTFSHILSISEEIRSLYKKHSPSSLTFVGCGSGYCLCQSGEISAATRLGITANTFAAGDLMLDPARYENMLKGTMIIAPSRSGSTSEVIRAIDAAKKLFGMPVIAISCVAGSELSKRADLVIELPWAFDESVCQTRTVTNLYSAQLMIIGILAGDNSLLCDIEKAIHAGDMFMESVEDAIKEVAALPWSKVVILADGELCGIASEGAIAFTEIAQLNSNYFHLLDVRHGPMVLVNEKTFVIAFLSSNNYEYQKTLIEDIVKRGAAVITFSDISYGAVDGVKLSATFGERLDMAASGIPFINLSQLTACYKAENLGINPDNPDGIVAWVSL